MATTEQPASTEPSSHLGDFGANEWLVEDMYERYQADPSSVDEAWHDFFKDYRPGSGGNGHQVQDAAPAAEQPTPAASEGAGQPAEAPAAERASTPPQPAGTPGPTESAKPAEAAKPAAKPAEPKAES